LSFYLTKGNVDDRDWRHFSVMTRAIFGKLFGDKGYVSKMLADLLWGNGIQMVAKPKKNMKNVNISQQDRILLRKRAIIECVNDEPKTMRHLPHTRHRSAHNFLMNLLGALAAYSFFPTRPSSNIEVENSNHLVLAA